MSLNDTTEPRRPAINTKHGKTGSPEYRAWTQMKLRCNNPGMRQYNHYGGRGIRVCARWMESFENFYADMGPRPSSKHTLDRIDNDGPYSPANCRWATWEAQGNNRRSNHLLTHNGQTLTLSQWAKKLGIRLGTIHYRLRTGLSIEDVLSTVNLPPKRRK